MNRGIITGDKDYTLWVLLHRTRDVTRSVRVRETDKAGISLRQATILLMIEVLGNRATPTEISRWLFRESHSVSETISIMERDGLVRRFKDLPKKNMVRVEMTEKGREKYECTAKRASVQRIMSRLSDKEKQQLSRCLWKIYDAGFEELGNKKKPPWP